MIFLFRPFFEAARGLVGILNGNFLKKVLSSFLKFSALISLGVRYQSHFCLGYITQGHPTCRHQLRCRVDITPSITLLEDSLQGCRWHGHKHSRFFIGEMRTARYTTQREGPIPKSDRGESYGRKTLGIIYDACVSQQSHDWGRAGGSECGDRSHLRTTLHLPAWF